MTRLKCPRCDQAVIHPEASHHDEQGYASDLCDRCEDECDEIEADESARRADSGQPTMYPCGCSRHKVNAGLCDSYKPGELP